MINVTHAFKNGGRVVLNEQDNVTADYGGEPNCLNECPTDFHAKVGLEDGQSVKVFIRRGQNSHDVDSIVTVELCAPGKCTGREIFRRWLKASVHDSVLGNG